MSLAASKITGACIICRAMDQYLLLEHGGSVCCKCRIKLGEVVTGCIDASVPTQRTSFKVRNSDLLMNAIERLRNERKG